MNSLFFLELKLLIRERSAWILIALFIASLAYGIWNGSEVAGRTHENVTKIRAEAEKYETRRTTLLQTNQFNIRQLYFSRFWAILPPAPLPFLATGQSDISPGHEQVAVYKLSAPADSRSELDNPSHLMAGRFDLAFVRVWLFPLFLLAFVYDLISGDRESGTLRIALSQGTRPFSWLLRRALARALPILILALIATGFATSLGESDGASSRGVLTFLLVLVYGFFWIALSAAINSVASNASSSATLLGAAWVALVLVAPTLLNMAVETLHPTPSRPELVSVSRQASRDAEEQVDKLVESFYQEHPELAPASKRANAFAQRITIQGEIGQAIEPIHRKFDEQLRLQQANVNRWRFISPAIAAHEALTDLAGTGYWRYRAFRDQAVAFRQEVHDFVAPKFHKMQSVTRDEADAWPSFVFQEESDAVWQQRVHLGILGIFALALVLTVFAGWNLRAGRVGHVTS